MPDSTKLISGRDYTLAGLLNNDRKIIIPDLQRDYCWGDKTHGDKKDELVSGFVNTLLEAYEEKQEQELTLGLIYAYEEPDRHIQLCDGQQRLTTLFLLLGMLNKRNHNLFRPHLISDFEYEQDDREPYLQYSIRESTLYFLSDLVCEYFLSPEQEKVAVIKTKEWYFREYDTDPSIRSMLAALGAMEVLLEARTDTAEFGSYVLNRLGFLYYDMGTRQNGEETFVVINTTGEPLTATENLKPVLLGRHTGSGHYGNELNPGTGRSFNEEWENREAFFWKSRIKGETTADEGLNQFFIWYWQIKLLQENDWKTGKARLLNPVALFSKYPGSRYQAQEAESYTLTEDSWKENVKLEEVEKYFAAYVFLKEQVYLNERCRAVLNTILEFYKVDNNAAAYCRKLPLHFLLPLLEFCVAYNQSDATSGTLYHFIRRLRKNHFDLTRPERRKNSVDWRHVIQIIRFSDVQHPESALRYINSGGHVFKTIQNVVERAGKWYGGDEQTKDILRVENAETLEKWEDHSHFMGDLSPLLEAHALTFPGRELNIEELDGLYKVYDYITDSSRYRDDVALSNNITLLSICHRYKNRGFSAQYQYYCAIEREDEKYLFYKPWFCHLWKSLYESYAAGEDINPVLAAFNRKIFYAAVKAGRLTDTVIEADITNHALPSREQYDRFVNERASQWGAWEGYVFATVFALLYMEILAAEDTMLKAGSFQYGIRPYHEEELEGRNTFGNLVFVSHSKNSSHVFYPFPLTSQVCDIHRSEKLAKELRIHVANQVYENVLAKFNLFPVPAVEDVALTS